MEEFPEERPRAPRRLDHTAKTTDLWEGQRSDPRIGQVGHIERADDALLSRPTGSSAASRVPAG